jgi:uncharacterized protein
MTMMLPRLKHPPHPTEPPSPRTSDTGLTTTATRPSTASPFAFLLLGLLLPALFATAEQQRSDLRLVEALRAGDTTLATADFTDDLRKRLTDERLAEVWRTLSAGLGRLDRIEPMSEARHGDLQVRVLRLGFERGELDAQVASDGEGRIHGLFFRPAPPPPAQDSAAGFHEIEIETGAAGWPLPGILTLPDGSGPFPAVVLVHGSGPNDRDLSIGANRPFRDIAHGLAGHGIASLRYDKRTLRHAERLAMEVEAITLEEEVTADAVAALQWLGGRDEIDAQRRYVLGLSLGALMAPRIAERASDIAGLLMLAPPARPLHQIIPAQVRYIAELDGEISEAGAESIRNADALRDAISRVLEGEEVDVAWTGAPAEYWRDLDAYDAMATAAALDIPILLLQGDRDYQVTVADDFVRWSEALAAHGQAELEVLAGLNHLFIHGEGPGNPAEYMRPGRVDAAAIERMASWILRSGRARR